MCEKNYLANYLPHSINEIENAHVETVKVMLLMYNDVDGNDMCFIFDVDGTRWERKVKKNVCTA